MSNETSKHTDQPAAQALTDPPGSPAETPETDALLLEINEGPEADLCRKLERERNEARREAEIERDRFCHRDHGGHVFPWQNAKSTNAEGNGK